MSTSIGTKINKLLASVPPGAVLLSSWLVENGYSYDLQQRYKKTGWLKSVGTGALVRSGDTLTYKGALFALQKQAGFSIHPGGRTALALMGKAHYLDMNNPPLVLFGRTNEKIPAWFTGFNWGMNIDYHHSSFLKKDLGMVDLEAENFSIKISGPARAILECLYLSPSKQDVVECYQIMEGLNDLSPVLVQSLLENCKSIKVKRMFLFMAERANHRWFADLELTSIDLGKGKRSIVSNGFFVEKYGITIPREIIQSNEPGI